jgi:heme O synthase-like polyprenyltransferase
MFNSLLIILGLIVAMAGVGGVDVSPDLQSLLLSTVVSVVGVVMMWIGTAGINENSDRYIHYNMKRR